MTMINRRGCAAALRRSVGMTLHERGSDLCSEVKEMSCCRAVIVEARVLPGLCGGRNQMPQRLDGHTDHAVIDPYRPYGMRTGGSLIVFCRCLHDDLGSGFRGHQTDVDSTSTPWGSGTALVWVTRVLNGTRSISSATAPHA
jgi:hypothetical protein